LAKWRWIAAVLLGYALACAAVVVIHQGAAQWPFTWVALSNGWLLTATMSGPGFVVLRGLLWAMRTVHWFSFAVAGALNGVAALSIFGGKLMPNVWFAAMGLVVGLIYWAVERKIARTIVVRTGVPASGV
jgi:hypothetical protein